MSFIRALVSLLLYFIAFNLLDYAYRGAEDNGAITLAAVILIIFTAAFQWGAIGGKNRV